MHAFMQIDPTEGADTGHGDPPPKPPKREIPKEKDPIDAPAEKL